MAEQHKKILKALGLPAAQIDALETMNETDAANLKVEDYVSPVKAIFQTQFLNDDSFLESIPEEKTSKVVKKNIEKGQYARFMNEMKDVAKELGISYDDLSPEIQTSIKGFYKETVKKAGTKEGSAAALAELQGKLQIALAEKTTLETSTADKISKAVNDATASYSAKLERAATIAAMVGKTTVPAEYIVDTVIAKIKEVGTPVFNADTMSFAMKQKNNPELDVLKSDGTKTTFTETLDEILKKDNLFKVEKTAAQIAQEAAAAAAAAEEERKKVIIEVNGKNPVPDYIQKNIDKGLKEEEAKK